MEHTLGKVFGIKVFVFLSILVCFFTPLLTNAFAGDNQQMRRDVPSLAQSPTEVINESENKNASPFAGLSEFGIEILMSILGGIAIILKFFANFFLDLSAYILDMTMQFSIYGLSNIVNSHKTAIVEGWTVFRDLANIGFVFVMLYIAIKFILQSDSSDTKKLLSSVIIAAFLVNFSFFFTGVIIDTANQFSIMFNNSLVQEMNGKTVSQFIAEKTDIERTLEEKIGSKFGTGTTAPGAATGVEQKDSFTKSFDWAVGAILSLILVLVLAFVFLFAAFMLIARTIALILLLITSPIGFAGKILPAFEKTSKEWWGSLIGNAFFLPAFLAFTWIAFKLMNTGMLSEVTNYTQTGTGSLLNPAGGAGNQNPLQETAQQIGGAFVLYTIVIGLFLAALQTAKKLSSMGSDALSKLSASITQTVGGAAIGGAGFVGRRTLGFGANALAEKMKNTPFATSLAGRATLGGLRNVAGSSFDLRANKQFQGVASATGVGEKVFGDPSKTGKKGYAGVRDAAVKDRKEYADSLGKLSDSDEKIAPLLVDLTAETGNLATMDAVIASFNQDILKEQEIIATPGKSKALKDAAKIEIIRIKKQIADIKASRKDQLEAVEKANKEYTKAKSLSMKYAGNIKGKPAKFWIGNSQAAKKIEESFNENEAGAIKKQLDQLLKQTKKDD